MMLHDIAAGTDLRISEALPARYSSTSACYFNGKERDSLIDQLHATSPDGLERVVRGAARRVDDEISTLWAGTATRVRALASCTAASLTIRARSAVVCAGFVDGLLVLGRRAPGSSSKPHFELVHRRLPCLWVVHGRSGRIVATGSRSIATRWLLQAHAAHAATLLR